MKILTLDYETFFSQEYSLSKMTTEEYLRDPRFETILVGLKMDAAPAVWVPQPKIKDIFSKLDWANLIVLMQHSHFDAAILNWHYGIKLSFICDTLPMFRALYPAESAALSNIPKVLGLAGEKGNATYWAKGLRYSDFTTRQLQEYGEYCCQDCELTYQAFQKMKDSFPVRELQLIDLTTRLFTEPILELDGAILKDLYDDEREKTVKVFSRIYPDKETLARKAIFEGDELAWKAMKTPLSSNQQFAEILDSLGVDPPKKLSPAAVKKGLVNPDAENEAPTGLLKSGEKIWAYAFSKGDSDFKLLQEHELEEVRILVEARLNVKSTIKTTRAKRFMGMAERGSFPVYVNAFGAHTGRFSGGDSQNPQNLTRTCEVCDGSKEIEVLE